MLNDVDLFTFNGSIIESFKTDSEWCEVPKVRRQLNEFLLNFVVLRV